MDNELFTPRARARSRADRHVFTPGQLQAIEHELGPCRVLAGPGSGKTTVLTHRYGRLLNEAGARPRRCLVITFTVKAADEMHKRICKLVGAKVPKTWIGTMHSKFLSILRHEYGRLETMSDIDVRVSLGTLTKNLGLSYVREVDQDELVRALDVWRIAMVTPEMAIRRTERRTAERHPGVYEAGLRPSPHKAPRGEENVLALAMWQIAHLYQAFQRHKADNGFVDFPDMIFRTWQLLSGNERVRTKWANAFEYVMVDEFQDIDPCQWEVVKMLSQESGNLFVVGDDDQAIYGFRGARPKILIDFAKTFPGAKTILLEDNFRCPSNIVEMSNAAIALNTERVPKSFVSSKDPVDPTVLRPLGTDEEGEAVVEEIKSFLQIGSKPGDCVVVYRTHAQSLPFEVRLMEADIPYVIRKGTCFYDIREVSDLVHYLEIATGRFDMTSLERVGNRPTRYLSKAVLQKWRQQFGMDIDGMLSVRGLQPHQREALGKFYHTIQRLESLCTQVDAKTGEIIPKGDTLSILETIDRVTGYRQWARDQVKKVGNPDTDLTATFGQLWTAAVKQPDPIQFMHSVARTRDFAKKKRLAKDAVTLSTFHGVKGLEYKHVFLVGMVEGLMPHERSVTKKELEEERRLAHVGFTRTQHSVMITSPMSEGRPSRFLKEWGLWKDETETTTTNESSSTPSTTPSSTQEDRS